SGHTRLVSDWSSDVCSADLAYATGASAFTYTAAAYYAGKRCSTVAAVRTEGATDSALLNNFAIPGMADAGKKFATVVTVGITQRSEERRVGKEGRCVSCACQ